GLRDEIRENDVVTFDLEKGYGFIKNQRTKESIFFHSQQVTGTVAVGDMVTFQMSMGNRGPAASGVVKI
ncbi:MAG: cold shock domain-containing protein, partial [Sphingobacteriia bacterium]|nr:cold shock domain-containing protein [Sphingobacteriia bacterium]